MGFCVELQWCSQWSFPLISNQSGLKGWLIILSSSSVLVVLWRVFVVINQNLPVGSILWMSSPSGLHALVRAFYWCTVKSHDWHLLSKNIGAPCGNVLARRCSDVHFGSCRLFFSVLLSKGALKQAVISAQRRCVIPASKFNEHIAMQTLPIHCF